MSEIMAKMDLLAMNHQDFFKQASFNDIRVYYQRLQELGREAVKLEAQISRDKKIFAQYRLIVESKSKKERKIVKYLLQLVDRLSKRSLDRLLEGLELSPFELEDLQSTALKKQELKHRISEYILR